MGLQAPVSSGASGCFQACLLHHFAHLAEVFFSLGGGAQVLGAAVFAFEVGVDHANLAQHIKLAVDGGGRGDVGHGHGVAQALFQEYEGFWDANLDHMDHTSLCEIEHRRLARALA